MAVSAVIKMIALDRQDLITTMTGKMLVLSGQDLITTMTGKMLALEGEDIATSMILKMLLLEKKDIETYMIVSMLKLKRKDLLTDINIIKNNAYHLLKGSLPVCLLPRIFLPLIQTRVTTFLTAIAIE